MYQEEDWSQSDSRVTYCFPGERNRKWEEPRFCSRFITEVLPQFEKDDEKLTKIKVKQKLYLNLAKILEMSK